MLYIFEGPRNSGKTTAVRRIQAALGERAYVIKFHRTAHPPMFMTDFLTKNYLALIDSRSICILDRFHLTEFVMRSLDKKVDEEILFTTTHMIDIMLKHIGAVTYVLNTSIETRKSRVRLRDVDHQKAEWPDYKQLDDAWTLATKMFHRSKVKVWPAESETDINKLVVDVGRHVKGGTRITERIPFLAPKIEVRQLEVA